MESSFQPRISILIPVYNGSKYLRKTLDSILGQTFPDYEVICINDCSTDDSLTILEEYRATDPRLRVLSTPANQGIVPKVLNFAIPCLRGDYFVYASQDDLFSPDWLQSMFERAVSTGADATIPDLVLYHEHEAHKNTVITAPNGDKGRVLTNREAVLLSLDCSIPGNALYAVRLLQQIKCYDFAMNADDYTVRVFLFHCNKVVFSGGTFYYRQDNPDAITKKLSVGTFDYAYTDYRLFEFLREHDFPGDAQEFILLRSLDALIDFRYALSTYRVRRWIRRQMGPSLNIEEAERRVRRCFDALRKANAPARLSELGSSRARRIRMMLANYAGFYALSLVAIGARKAKSKLRAAAS